MTSFTIYQSPGAQPVTMAPTITTHDDEAERIIEEVCRTYKISRADLVGEDRHDMIVFPRHLAMTLIRQLTPYSLHQIGALFSNRDHATVIHAIKRIRQRCDLAGDHPGEFARLYRKLCT